MAGRRSDNEIPPIPPTEVIPPGLEPEEPLTQVRELAPYLGAVEQARDKVTKVRLQVIERVRRGLLTSETANALIQDAEMELERAEMKFDKARYDTHRAGRSKAKGKQEEQARVVGPRKMII